MLDTQITPVGRLEQSLRSAVIPRQSKQVEEAAKAGAAWAKERNDYENVVNYNRVYILARRVTTELIVPEIRNGDHGLQTDRYDGAVIPVLADFGFTAKQWHRRRQELAVPVEQVEQYIDDCIVHNSTPSPFGLLRFVAEEKSPAANIIHVSDDSYEWFTPSEYIEAARAVMSGIDLDPASCAAANRVVKAKRFYTRDDDGLSKAWRGRVWLNPPYNMPLVDQFADKIIAEFKAGNVESAIVLTNNSTDTRWFHKLAQYPICLTRGRVTFWNGDDTLAARQGQALFYLGVDVASFVREFAGLGLVLCRYDH